MLIDVFSVEVIVFFFALSLAASFVNGALGYGFSSLAIPIAVLFFPNRILNPAFVIVELLVNSIMLTYERAHFRRVLPRAAPIVVSLLPGVVAGSYLLSVLNPTWVRVFLYATMLPLILLQAAGIRRPIKSELGFKIPFGVGVGLCYSLTTISGPPIALFWNNQGLTKNEFRAALAQVRLGETVFTGLAYLALRLYSPVSLQLSGLMLIPMIIGVPLGALTVKRVGVEVFRRVCMSFDAWIVAYGLSKVLGDIGLITGNLAYSIFAITILIDLVLLYRFFGNHKRIQAVSVSNIPGKQS
ncbi:MAG TPA: sulfite exporter TauE/SafE family protein [Candidatus Bathyarchaeia archaeon]|nr:sulfite exporter TauE/SafE family protein [Candidatus Bathyarchaeia archaeon]